MRQHFGSRVVSRQMVECDPGRWHQIDLTGGMLGQCILRANPGVLFYFAVINGNGLITTDMRSKEQVAKRFCGPGGGVQ